MIYGYDPYNSADRCAMGKRVVSLYHGPLGSIAYRSQQSWDFTPGDTAAKLSYYQQHGLHRLPLRSAVPGLARRQAE